MLNELICYAENKRDEAAENNPDDVASIRYWVGYIDGIEAVARMLKGGEGDG